MAKTANHAKASKNMLTGGIEDLEGKEGTPVSNPSIGSLVAHARGASDKRNGMPTYAFLPPVFAPVQGCQRLGQTVDEGGMPETWRVVLTYTVVQYRE